MRFICRTKKFEKLGGFSDHTKRIKPQSRQGSAASVPIEEKFAIKPEEIAYLALVNFGEGHDDLKVQMMARACYPEIKISRSTF